MDGFKASQAWDSPHHPWRTPKQHFVSRAVGSTPHRLRSFQATDCHMSTSPRKPSPLSVCKAPGSAAGKRAPSGLLSLPGLRRLGDGSMACISCIGYMACFSVPPSTFVYSVELAVRTGHSVFRPYFQDCFSRGQIRSGC